MRLHNSSYSEEFRLGHHAAALLGEVSEYFERSGFNGHGLAGTPEFILGVGQFIVAKDIEPIPGFCPGLSLCIDCAVDLLTQNPCGFPG